MLFSLHELNQKAHKLHIGTDLTYTSAYMTDASLCTYIVLISYDQ